MLRTNSNVLDWLWNCSTIKEFDPDTFVGHGIIKRRIIELVDGGELYLLRVLDNNGKIILDQAFKGNGEWNRAFAEYSEKWAAEIRKREQALEQERLERIGRGKEANIELATPWGTLKVEAVCEGKKLKDWRIWSASEVYTEFPCGCNLVLPREPLINRLKNAANSLDYQRRRTSIEKPSTLSESPAEFDCECGRRHAVQFVVLYPK